MKSSPKVWPSGRGFTLGSTRPQKSNSITYRSWFSDTCVIIYATHSHHLINPNWLENTYVVRNLGIDNEADVTDYHALKTNIDIQRYRAFASQHPDQSHYYQPILDVLEYTPSQLELVPEVVIVEGKNDFYALRYLNDVVLDLGLDLNFLPGTGAGNLGRLISLYIGWGRNCVVLLDSDPEGGTQKRRYNGQFGSIMSPRLFTLGDIHGDLKGKSLERGFEAEDRNAIQDAIYQSQPYRKRIFFQAIQELLATRTPVAVSPPTTERFSDVLKALEATLEGLRTS